MSVSRAESCLRMPNISSCLRIVDAFSTSSSSANETSSAGVLVFSSWSFISRIRNVLWKSGRRRVGNCNAADRKEKKKCRRSWVARSFGAPVPMHQPAPIHWSQNPIASAYVRWDGVKIGKQSASGKRPNVLCTGNALMSKRFQHHEQNDNNHRDCWYLVDYPIEFWRMLIAVGGESLYPAGE